MTVFRFFRHGLSAGGAGQDGYGAERRRKVNKENKKMKKKEKVKKEEIAKSWLNEKKLGTKAY